MDLAYLAHSERCALLLDSNGVCRWIVPKVDEHDEVIVAAKRCVGAQFVASLDAEAPGLLGSEPRVGTSLLFALIDDGRISLVRFGPLQRFEKLDARESAANAVTVAADVNVEATTPTEESTDSASVFTSAPLLRSAEPTTPQVETPPEPAVPAAPVTSEDMTIASEASETELLPPELARVPDLDDVLDALDEDQVITVSREAPVTATPNLEAMFDQLASGNVPITFNNPIFAVVSRNNRDDSQIDIVTSAFARSDGVAAEIQSELDLDVDTSLFTRDEVMEASNEARPLLRPSGFVMRNGATVDDAGHDGDDSTCRFARAVGGAPLDLARRGMLPRR